MLYQVTLKAKNFQVTADTSDAADRYVKSDADEFVGDWNYTAEDVCRAAEGSDPTIDLEQVRFEVEATAGKEGPEELWTFDATTNIYVHAAGAEHAKALALLIPKVLRYPIPVVHPLPIGTQILVMDGGTDEGVMSWDDANVTIDRQAPAGSTCYISGVDDPRYDVEFLPSEVWNILEPSDFATKGDNFKILSLGDGSKPAFAQEHYDYPQRCERDPEAVQKIAEELSETPAL